MAQASSMGPPLSPRETRRSGRRSAHSGSTSTSKSPDSDPLPRPKDGPQRPSLTSHPSGSRGKRLKQEDMDDPVVDRKNAHSGSTTSSSSAQGAATGRSRRKKKEKDEDLVPEESVDDGADDEPVPDAGDEDEEASVTRCVCGSTGESYLFAGLPANSESPRRGRPGCRRIYGAVRDVQSVAARSVYGVRIRGSAAGRRLLLRAVQAGDARRAAQVRIPSLGIAIALF